MNNIEVRSKMEAAMPAGPMKEPAPEPDRLEAATDQAIAACGGNARQAVKALLVTNEFLEVLIAELQAAASTATHAASVNPCRVIAAIGMIELQSQVYVVG